MLSVTFLLLGMLFTVRGTGAQLVTQPDGHINVSEGNHVELRCNYSYGGSIYLYWYVQYPNQGLQFLLKYLPGPTRLKASKALRLISRRMKTPST
uniref:Immunoglobulin V-set domain-containing protein n=1 Tax=Bos mutus grunniens TaxID=30521 RepID=A0A8B9X0G4_BOSMU